jgi:SAM-dependent methyltransferase
MNGRRVLEVGSYDVNGSPRRLIGRRFAPGYYWGVDTRPGPGVDEVMDAAQAGVRYAGRFDVVISTEMLEHAADWRGAVTGMKYALVPGGRLFLSARGPGFGKHDHPHDHWRFTPQDMGQIFADMAGVAVVEDCQFPGVFVRARRPHGDWSPRGLSGVAVAGAPA